MQPQKQSYGRIGSPDRPGREPQKYGKFSTGNYFPRTTPHERDSAQHLAFIDGGIVLQERVASRDEFQDASGFPFAHNTMGIHPIVAHIGNKFSAHNFRGATPLDSQNIPGVKRGNHAGTERGKPDLSEIAHQLASELDSHGLPGLWRRFDFHRMFSGGFSIKLALLLCGADLSTGQRHGFEYTLASERRLLVSHCFRSGLVLNLVGKPALEFFFHASDLCFPRSDRRKECISLPPTRLILSPFSAPVQASSLGSEVQRFEKY